MSSSATGGNTTGPPVPVDLDTNYAYFTGFALAVASAFLIAWSYILKKVGLERYAARSERQDGYFALEPAEGGSGAAAGGLSDSGQRASDAESVKRSSSEQHHRSENGTNGNGGSTRRRAAEGSVGYLTDWVWWVGMSISALHSLYCISNLTLLVNYCSYNISCSCSVAVLI